MGYYMRFLSTDPVYIGLKQIERAMQSIDSKYHLDRVSQDKQSADLCHDGSLYGELDVSRIPPGEDDEEIEELMEDAEASDEDSVESVVHILGATKSIVAVRVLWQDRSPEQTLSRIDPLWDWLFEHFNGLLHADGEGFYDRSGILLRTQ